MTTGRSVIAAAALCCLLASSAPAGAQDYEALYGPIIDVSLDDLFNGGTFYDGRGVRLTARLDLYAGAGSNAYTLSEGVAAQVWLVPVPELRNQFEMEASRYLGRHVEVVGRFDAGSETATAMRSGPRGRIDFWEFSGPPEKQDGEIKASDISLESLVRSPGERDGQMVRVVGQFRGRNLFRDLPASSQMRSNDWVLKNDIFAVWITGRRPRGDGFRLDGTLKRDTGKWLEVVGKVRTRRDTTYIDALQVRLVSAPLDVAAGAAPTPTPPARTPKPPVVVFSLPLDGEVIPTATLFQVQFNKDMDEDSFAGRVVLRYAGARQPGDRLFDGVRIEYDGGLRTLIVDPGDVLRPGRQVLLMLLQGIKDLEGLGLEPRSERAAAEAEVADVLSYRVAAEFEGS
jgi:hypothetical protein